MLVANSPRGTMLLAQLRRQLREVLFPNGLCAFIRPLASFLEGNFFRGSALVVHDAQSFDPGFLYAHPARLLGDVQLFFPEIPSVAQCAAQFEEAPAEEHQAAVDGVCRTKPQCRFGNQQR